jgi:hypothetical protein
MKTGMNVINKYLCIVLFFVVLMSSNFIYAQLVPPASEATCVGCNRKMSTINAYGHGPGCPYAPQKKAASSSSSVVPYVSSNLNMMIAGTIIQSAFASIFSSNSQQQQQQKIAEQQKQLALQMEKEKQKKIKDSIELEKYKKLMGSYKSFQDAPRLDFKTMDGDMEATAAAARDPFSGKIVMDSTKVNTKGTNFFGTKMSDADIQVLIYPEKNPVIIDVEKANQYLKEKRIEDGIKKAELEKKEAVKKTTECETLLRRYNGYITQREKFHKTIELTAKELDEWKERNNDALKNAAMSGFELVLNTKILGENGLIGKIEKRGADAENIKQRLLLHMDELRGRGVNVDNYLKTLNARIFNKNFLAKDISEFKDAVEYQAYFRDAIQVSISTVGETDSAYAKILQDTSIQLLMNDGQYPGIDAAQFVTGKVLEKLIASQFLGNLMKFNNKIPYVTYAQFAVDEAYHAFDFLLSYDNILQQRDVQGQELRAAMSLQMQIDKTYNQLKDCPPNM